MRRTKIIITYGPSLHADGALEQVIPKIDVIRINFSHNNEKSWLAMKQRVLDAIGASGRDIKILADMPGPKVRIGELESGIKVAVGEQVSFSYAKNAAPGAIPVNYENLYMDAREGAMIIIGDGEPRFKINSIRDKNIHTTALTSGIVGSKKGLGLSGASMNLQVPTDEDVRLGKFAKQEEFDYMALSFVRSAEQIDTFRKEVGGAFIISKVERGDAVDNINTIAMHSDAIMVARGNLGLDIPFEEVPVAQIKIMEAAKRHGKPVIVATQVLTSMIANPIPTRAEVNDIANNVLNEADYIMLSDETTTGKYPVEAVNALYDSISAIQRYRK